MFREALREQPIEHKNVSNEDKRCIYKEFPWFTVAKEKEKVRYLFELFRIVVAVVRKPIDLGFLLRESKRNFDSNHNENFLLAIEMLTEFDSLFNKHFKNYI